MGTISARNEATLAQFAAYGIDTTPLRKEYGLKFVLKLLAYLRKHSAEKKARFDVLWPPLKSGQTYHDMHWSYIEKLEVSRIPLVVWEDYVVDEDTGGFVPVNRHSFKRLRKIKKPPIA